MLHLGNRPIAILSLWLGLLCGVAGAVAAERGSDVFTVRDVAVDTTAATAAAARDQALSTGQRRAFQRLLERLTQASDAKRLPKPSDAALINLTEGYEVQEEKHSTVRYIATLTYRFKPAPIEQLLRDAAIAFAETPSKPVLVLPLLRNDRALALWEDPNPWRTAWAKLPPADGLVPFVVPVGDLNDISAIDAQAASSGDAQKLAALEQRYEAGSALVAIATLRPDRDGKPRLVDLTATRRGGAAEGQVIVSSVAVRPGESADDLLARAAAQIESEISERWKSDNLLHFDQAQEVLVAAPLTRLEDWLELRSRLDSIASVTRSSLLFLARDEAQLNLQYLGDLAQLKLVLAQRDLILTEEGGRLLLRLAASSAPGAGSAAETAGGGTNVGAPSH